MTFFPALLSGKAIFLGASWKWRVSEVDNVTFPLRMVVSVGRGRYVKCGCSKALPVLDGRMG